MMKKITVMMTLVFFVIAYGQGQSTPHEYFKASQELFKNKEYDKAISTIDKAIQLDSRNRDYLILKTTILYNDSKCNEAMEVLDKIYALNGKKYDDDIIAYAVQLYDCFDKTEVATKILKNYVDKKKYTNVDLVVFLAQRLANLGDIEGAQLYYDEVIKLNPDDIASTIDYAKILFTYKSPEDARVLLYKSLTLHPNNLSLLIYMAGYYLQIQDYDKALDYQNRVLLIENNNARLGDRAGIYELKGMKKEAYFDYLKIVETDKCNIDYYTRILKYEFDNRMYKENIEHSYKLISCNSAYKESLLDGLYTSFFFYNDFKKGTEYLNEKLSLRPDNFNPYYTKVLILFQDKQYDEIPKYIDLALKAKDIEDNDIINLGVLKMAYYLIVEDFEGFVSYWKHNDGKNVLDNNLSFTVIEETMGEKAELRTIFDKDSGIIKSSLIVPTKVFRLLRDKYGLVFDVKAN